MDIRLVRKQLQVEFANLNSADFDAASIAANDFLDFINSNETISEIRADLPKNEIDIDQWTKDFHNSRDLSLPRNKQERVSFLLAALDKYKDDLLQISHQFHAGSIRSLTISVSTSIPW